MNRTWKVSLALVVAFVAALAIFVVVDRSDAAADAVSKQVAADPASVAVRENSHRLNSVPDGRITFVEFLDFECEACRSAYPAIEQLRADYGNRVSFVVRYFPIASHFNAERAARAVEAAAQQGRFESMYQRMFETQSEWGEQRTPKDDLFRSFAVDFGLDMAAFDSAYNDPATLTRIEADFADGIALGVQGTPTYFIDGAKIEPTTYGDLTDALDAALG